MGSLPPIFPVFWRLTLGNSETHPDSAKPSSDWPDKGHIELKDVTYRHYPDGPLVLKGVSVTILPSEKVIVLLLWYTVLLMLSHSDWYSQ